MPATETWAILAATCAACVVVVELFFRLPFIRCVESVNRASLRALDTVRSPRISDHWKEQVLPRYAARIALASLKLGALLLLCGIAFAGTYVLVGWLVWRDGHAVLATLGSGRVQLLALVVGVVWAVIRARAANRHHAHQPVMDHSPTSKMLHRLALGSRSMREFAFSIDGRRARRAVPSVKVERPVYVTGLARAGTTIVLEALYASGRFASLTYRDMPFIMAPYTWGGLVGRGGRKTELRERAHGDRLKVGPDSPEAFEEVFWTTFAGRDTADGGGLRPVGEAKPEVIESYRAYIRRILARARKRRQAPDLRYLAKDNNHILRLDWLREAFPDAVIVTPFRDPVSHAASLLRQHERFLARHATDPFGLEYMDWLGHFEFGAHHRPFLVGGHRPARRAAELLEPRYWLEYWASVYGDLLARHDDAVAWLDYGALCRDPASTLAALARAVGLPEDELAGWADHISAPAPVALPAFEAEVSDRVRSVYAALQARAI